MCGTAEFILPSTLPVPLVPELEHTLSGYGALLFHLYLHTTQFMHATVLLHPIIKRHLRHLKMLLMVIKSTLHCQLGLSKRNVGQICYVSFTAETDCDFQIVR